MCPADSVCQYFTGVAASDAHERKDVGRCATEFERRISGLDDLITELKAGHFKPIVLDPASSRPLL